MSTKGKNGPPQERGVDQGAESAPRADVPEQSEIPLMAPDAATGDAQSAREDEPEVLQLEGFAIGDAVVQSGEQGEIELGTADLEAVALDEEPPTPVLEGLTDMFQTVAAEVEAEMEGEVEEVVITGDHPVVTSQPALHGLTDMFQTVAAEVEAELAGQTEQVEIAGAPDQNVEASDGEPEMPDVLDGFTAAFQQVKQVDPAEIGGVVIERRVVDEGDFSEDEPQLPDVSDGLTAAFQLVQQPTPTVEPELEGLEIKNEAIDGEWVPDETSLQTSSKGPEEDEAPTAAPGQSEEAEDSYSRAKALPTDLHEAVKSYLEDEPEPTAPPEKKSLPTDVHNAVKSYLDDADKADVDLSKEPDPEPEEAHSATIEEPGDAPGISLDDYLPRGSDPDDSEPESTDQGEQPEPVAEVEGDEEEEAPPKFEPIVGGFATLPPRPPPKKKVELPNLEFARFPSLVQRNAAGPTESSAALPSDDDEVDFHVGMSSTQKGLDLGHGKQEPVAAEDEPATPQAQEEEEEEPLVMEPILGGFSGLVPEPEKKETIAPFEMRKRPAKNKRSPQLPELPKESPDGSPDEDHNRPGLFERDEHEEPEATADGENGEGARDSQLEPGSDGADESKGSGPGETLAESELFADAELEVGKPVQPEEPSPAESEERTAEPEERAAEPEERAAEPEERAAEPEERAAEPKNPAPPEPKKSAVNPLLVLIIGLLLGALVTLLMDRNSSQPETQPDSPGEDAVDPEPEQTPEPIEGQTPPETTGTTGTEAPPAAANEPMANTPEPQGDETSAKDPEPSPPPPTNDSGTPSDHPSDEAPENTNPAADPAVPTDSAEEGQTEPSGPGE